MDRADADLLAFYQRFGMLLPAGEHSMPRVVDPANQHRYLRHATGNCSGRVPPRVGAAAPVAAT
ncbi:hypothetical protein ACIRLA_36640 [Streptomyces sp. NPDC102364]|uniref:hypothetical protein n=1 Tax=Streptomyces sp. NPDC102364 TaxID=3366161 RepID=UPI0037FFAEBA